MSHSVCKAPAQYGKSKIVELEPENIIEAWQGGVRLAKNISEAHTPHTKVDIFSYVEPLSQEQEIVATKFLVAQLGKNYDYEAIVRFLTREPINRWNKSKWFCSELAFEASLVAGRRLLENCAAWEIPPRDIPRSPLLRLDRSEWTR
jgi:uncharacterized protein YycO